MVGNLLYYRFLNPAVVAPDAFDIVAMAAGGALATPQRHALGAVAQLLQHAAAGKAFSGESQHLRVLNDYLEETHLKFRSWVLASYPSLSVFSPSPIFFHVPLRLTSTRKRGIEVKGIVSELEDSWLEKLPSGEKRGLLKEGCLKGTLGEKEGLDRGAGAQTGESGGLSISGQGRRKGCCMRGECWPAPLSHMLFLWRQEVHLPSLPGARARRALCDG